MESNHPPMPELMRELHQIPVDYLDGEGIDFEPYPEFLSVKQTQHWFRAWTGNSDAGASAYLIFGQDGTGGYAALWRVRTGESLLQQPLVFFGSEGELGVIAGNFSDYLWLLASGHGPYEAVDGPDDAKNGNAEFTKFAAAHATTPQSKPSDIVAKAQAEFPDFEKDIRAICG